MTDRLAKFAAMLASSNDGEVLAAARVLAAELQKRNITFAGLVEAAERHFTWPSADSFII